MNNEQNRTERPEQPSQVQKTDRQNPQSCKNPTPQNGNKNQKN